MAAPATKPKPTGRPGSHKFTREEHEKFGAARLKVAHMRPYLAQALFALTPVAAPGLGTFAVDNRWRLYMDPERLNEWDVEGMAAVLVHEVGHVLRDHAGRAKALNVGVGNAAMWNFAADAEINDDIIAEGIKLPIEGVTPKSLGADDGKLAEEYYGKLNEQKQKAIQDLKDRLANGESLEDIMGNPGDGQQGTGPFTVTVGSGGDVDMELPDDFECGSGAHSHKRDFEMPDGAEGGDRSASGVSDSEADLIRRRTAEAIVEESKKNQGSVPAGLVRWAESVLKPVVNWRKVLTGAIRSSIADASGRVDYSYRRPARRRVPRVVMPAMQRPTPSVAVVIDTSGSMSNDMIGEAWAEVEGVLRSLGTKRERLSVIACDAAAAVVKGAGRKKAALSGGGGTDMGVGIETALDLPTRPDVVIVLTDGYTPWPDSKPKGTRVVVGLIGDDAPEAPEWARVIRITDERNAA